MKKLIEKIKTDKGISITLELDTERNIYIMTVEKDNEKAVFEGNISEIQEKAKKYFVKSLKNIKNKIEISILEELFNRS
ncbi:hypothetical protein [Hydrogenothermus marinus]|uniref:Uncharacterized protein n=1 Tax=Hydrogenothermus marinus TaxID=133270 RepID=A0A3M0B6Q5_9AQUI|nr:hypothetical protein [Hydrogenothermus marinus]RMA93053.1 hypothetical protein CLV39_1533 [Hydrogenothermus marinus]